jgi:DNA replication protein DnaC
VKWIPIFSVQLADPTAILDRLLHHVVTLNIRGNSYRLKEKLKEGLAPSAEDNTLESGGEI